MQFCMYVHRRVQNSKSYNILVFSKADFALAFWHKERNQPEGKVLAPLNIVGYGS